MLLWASKFATAKIECSFKIETKHLWGNIYFAGDDTIVYIYIYIYIYNLIELRVRSQKGWVWHSLFNKIYEHGFF